MRYQRLGSSGLKVSEICLGTMTFGKYTDASEASSMVELALDAGVNFLDTANAYNGGACEEILGEVLAGKRDRFVIASKAFNPMGPGINDSGWSRRHLYDAVEGILRRLRTDYLDLFYLHHIDRETPLEEALETMEDLVRSGKVRYTAVSNFEAWRLMEAWWTSRSRGWTPIVALQPQYSLVVRDIEEEIVPACLEKGIGIVPWGPMAGGFLTGKYRPGGERVQEGTRSADGWVFPKKFFHPEADRILTTFLEAAGEIGQHPAQLALRWALAQPGITSVIAGARNREQLESNLRAATWELDIDVEQRLTEISAPRQHYPRTMEANMHERRADAVAKPEWP